MFSQNTHLQKMIQVRITLLTDWIILTNTLVLITNHKYVQFRMFHSLLLFFGHVQAVFTDQPQVAYIQQDGTTQQVVWHSIALTWFLIFTFTT